MKDDKDCEVLILFSNLFVCLFVYCRRLCILKGVFPREPKKKVKGNHQTYYHLKDVLFLQHEPLLETFRDLRAYDKKIKKAKAKRNEERAKRLETLRPNYKIDRLIKERFVQILLHPYLINFFSKNLRQCLIMFGLLGIRNLWTLLEIWMIALLWCTFLPPYLH